MTNGLYIFQKNWSKYLLGGSITFLCLLIFVRQVNLTDLLTALKHFHWFYLILGISSLVFGYSFRIVRWSIMLKTTNMEVSFRKCSLPFLASIALNNILPLRLGDVVRVLVFPNSIGISKTTAASSLIIERLIDLMTLLLCLAIGIFAIKVMSIPSELKTSVITLAFIGSITLSLGFLFSGLLSTFFNQLTERTNTQNVHRMKKIYKTLANLLHNFNVMSRPKILLSILTISILVWVGEAGLFYFILLGVGMEGSPMVALLVMAIATISTLIPSSPGYIGSFHLATFTAISLVGGTAGQAGSFAIIVHLALWLPTTLAGILAIWMSPKLFEIAKSRAANNN